MKTARSEEIPFCVRKFLACVQSDECFLTFAWRRPAAPCCLITIIFRTQLLFVCEKTFWLRARSGHLRRFIGCQFLISLCWNLFFLARIKAPSWLRCMRALFYWPIIIGARHIKSLPRGKHFLPIYESYCWLLCLLFWRRCEKGTHADD